MQKPEVKNHFRLFKNYMNNDFLVFGWRGLSIVNFYVTEKIHNLLLNHSRSKIDLLNKIHYSPLTFHF